jgi:hypothetical protein
MRIERSKVLCSRTVTRGFLFAVAVDAVFVAAADDDVVVAEAVGLL